MTRALLFATLLSCIVPTVLPAQSPAAGMHFRVQLIAADTLPATTEDPRVLRGVKTSGHMVQCVRPDSGKHRRQSPECGPRIKDSGLRLLAETRLTSDAEGRARERLSWSGGDAVVELDASEQSRDASGDYVRLRIRFWSRLAPGEAAHPAAALQMTHTRAALGKAMRMYVMFKDGAEILVVLPERAGEPTPGSR